MNKSVKQVSIIGAGLAGSEAAIVLASHGIGVNLYEMRPKSTTPAHKTDKPAELVCSNSLKSDQLPTAHGLLKAELSLLNSPLLDCARNTAVPAGSALAVDRSLFSDKVEKLISSNPLINVICDEVEKPPKDTNITIITAGPLASDKLTSWIQSEFSSSSLSFYDAIAPIVSADSVNMNIAFCANRWDDENDIGDYINCPFTRDEYEAFYNELTSADSVVARDFEKELFFEACLPVEVIASRGFESLVFGPLRPIGFTDPRTGKRPYAVCQLRKENSSGDSLGLVGFQTRLTIPSQKKVFRMIPGLENAEFLRHGSIHRNTYINSPELLKPDLSFKSMDNVFVAGQLCGNEGYTESIATGHMVALSCLSRLKELEFSPPPSTTACGALLRHIVTTPKKRFTPSNINFGLIDSLSNVNKRRVSKAEKKKLLCDRALQEFGNWINKLKF